MLKKKIYILLLFIVILAASRCGGTDESKTSSSTVTAETDSNENTESIDLQNVNADRDSLTLESISFAVGEDSTSITQDFVVPVAGENGSVISWTCTSSSINVNSDGKALVSRPPVGSGDDSLTCTATITKGEESVTKDFTFTVLEFVLGASETITAGTVSFNLITALTGTFPTGTDDSGEATVSTAYQIAETETTNALVREVYQWAYEQGKMSSGTVDSTTVTLYGQVLLNLYTGNSQISFNGSTFSVDTGKEEYPIIEISWYGAIMFCNWLTEMVDGNMDNVVYSGMDSDWEDYETVENTSKTGFRLPSHNEWELAARYIGTTDSGYGIEKPAGSGVYWTPGDYASGATADYNNSTEVEAVAWYDSNSGSVSHIVKTKGVNQLGLYDMSGNVWEWVFDESGSERVFLGGSWGYYAYGLQVGYRNCDYADFAISSLGFRLAKTL